MLPISKRYVRYENHWWGDGLEEEGPRPVPGALGVNAGLDWPLVDREEALARGTCGGGSGRGCRAAGGESGREVQSERRHGADRVGCFGKWCQRHSAGIASGLGHTSSFSPENCIDKYA